MALLEDSHAQESLAEGHRARLRQRFIKGGADSLPDYELLELVLTTAIPRRDVKPLAKQLLAKFGSFAAVISAPIAALTDVKGLGETGAVALKVIAAAAARMLKQDLLGTPVLSSWQKLQDYLLAILAHEKIEHFRILFLNKKNHLIADEVQHSGTVDQTAAYPREIVKRALELGATAMILVHNHPSGDPQPSAADIKLTRDIVTAAQGLNIVVHDHLIVAKGGVSSLKNQGFMN